MSKVRNIVLSFATIILSLGILLPLHVAAETEEEVSEKQLFQTLQPVEMDDGIIIPKSALIYGIELQEGVEFQYGEVNTEIDRELVTMEGITEEDAVFVDDSIDSITSKQLLEGTTLTASNYNEQITITINHPIEYPVHMNEENEEYILLGNVAYNISYPEAEELEESVTSSSTDTVEEEETPADTAEETISEEKASTTSVDVAPTIATFSALKTVANTNPWAAVSSKFFQVTANDTTVFDNRGATLKPIGTLRNGQVYHRVSDYGNWHKIQFGNIYGYVLKSNTIPMQNANPKHKNKNYKNQSQQFTVINETEVFDNTSGKLVPIGKLHQGVQYPVASDYGNWWRIIYSDMVGYVLKSNTEINVPFTKNHKYFKVLQDGLPIYDNRTGKLIQVGALEKGKEYKRVSDYGNWHRVQFGNIYGYVLKSSTIASSGTTIKNENKSFTHSFMNFTTKQTTPVFDNSSGALVQIGTIDQGVQYKIASDYGNWWRIIYSDMIAYVHKSNVKVTFSKDDKYFRALEDASIYDNRTGSLIRVGKLQKGKEYKRVSDYGNWHRIQFGNIYGYVRKSETEVSTGSSIPNENTRFTNPAGSFTTLQDVTVYDNTSGKLIPFASIDKGVEFTIATDYGNWWRILYSDMVGYVRKSEVDLNGLKLYLDPGHGAHDPGGTSLGLREKDMVLDIGLQTANYLRNNYLDVEIKLSRTDDTFVPLLDRSRDANQWGADYFVSLHTNALNGNARGFETFIYNGPVSQETIDRQRDIHNHIIKEMKIPDRGIKRADFSVLRNTQMPAMLIEYLFIDNVADNNLIKNASYRTFLARITAEAIAESFNLMKK